MDGFFFGMKSGADDILGLEVRIRYNHKNPRAYLNFYTLTFRVGIFMMISGEVIFSNSMTRLRRQYSFKMG